MPEFRVVSDFLPTGDQPQAIEGLADGLKRGFKRQTLLGVTGSGKTFTMANVIERWQRPTLVLAPNRTLARCLRVPDPPEGPGLAAFRHAAIPSRGTVQARRFGSKLMMNMALCP